MSRMALVLRNTDVLSGAVFIVVAAIFAFGASRLQMGTTVRMGPGYFPILLSAILALFGVLTIASGLRKLHADNTMPSVSWGRMAIVIAAVLFFALCLNGLGLPITVFGTTLIAASASREFRLMPSIFLGIGAAIVAWVSFRMLLGLPFQMFGAWLNWV